MQCQAVSSHDDSASPSNDPPRHASRGRDSRDSRQHLSVTKSNHVGVCAHVANPNILTALTFWEIVSIVHDKTCDVRLIESIAITVSFEPTAFVRIDGECCQLPLAILHSAQKVAEA